MICIYCRTTGSKSVYLVIIDGGADWVAAEHAVTAEFPWIHFLHCVAHEGSLIVKDRAMYRLGGLKRGILGM